MPARILFVDDDWFARQVYSDFLSEGTGHSVVTASSGEDALAKLKHERFEVVITDVVMPGIDGLRLLQLAKQADDTLDVIVLTSLDSVDTAVEALRNGAYDYMVKPVNPEALRLTVDRCLSNRNLLAENQELRRYVHLFETSQRIAACIEVERLCPVSLDALRAVARVRTGMFCLYEPEIGRFDVVERRGIGDEEAVWLTRQLQESWPDAMHDAIAPARIDGLGGVIRSRDAALRGLEDALVIPLRREDDLLGTVVLARRRDEAPLDPAQERDAGFLSSYVSLALQNSARYADAANMAYIDALTGLRNSRYLELAVERLIARRRGGEPPFAVLFMDLDYFKSVNDTHGHQIGSRALVEVARLLRHGLRDEDVLTRYGGDEYVAVLPDADAGQGVLVAERLRKAVEHHRFFAREGLNLQLTLCVGVAEWPRHAQTTEDVLHRADLAMYHGKKTHRNAVYVFDELPDAPEDSAG